MIKLSRLDAPTPYELWRIELDAEPSEDELKILSASERHRAARIRFQRSRVRYVSAHCALRLLLSAREGVAASSLQFKEGDFGKPRLHGRGTSAFSLSHSHDVALVALTNTGEIGVDVEVLQHIADATALADHHCTAAEREALARLEPDDRGLAFLFCWTRKEACLKAIGRGLNLRPHTFEVGLGSEVRVVTIDTPEGMVWVEVQSFRYDDSIVASLARVIHASLDFQHGGSVC